MHDAAAGLRRGRRRGLLRRDDGVGRIARAAVGAADRAAAALGARRARAVVEEDGLRAERTSVHIDDARISAAHCTLWRDAASRVWVQNTSMNGTLVSRQLLEKGATRELKSGDEIQLLNPRTPGAGAEAAPPKPPYVFLFQDLRPPPREPDRCRARCRTRRSSRRRTAGRAARRRRCSTRSTWSRASSAAARSPSSRRCDTRGRARGTR